MKKFILLALSIITLLISIPEDLKCQRNGCAWGALYTRAGILLGIAFFLSFVILLVIERKK